MSMDRATATAWWDEYVRAWAEQDVEATVELFTADATYRERWYAEPAAGREGLRDYWNAVARITKAARPGYEVLTTAGATVIARWWVTYVVTADDAAVALEGIAVVDHAVDGRAVAWREWFDARPSDGSAPAAGTSALSVNEVASPPA